MKTEAEIRELLRVARETGRALVTGTVHGSFEVTGVVNDKGQIALKNGRGFWVPLCYATEFWMEENAGGTPAETGGTPVLP